MLLIDLFTSLSSFCSDNKTVGIDSSALNFSATSLAILSITFGRSTYFIVASNTSVSIKSWLTFFLWQSFGFSFLP